jgi:hypothetical protein
MGDVRLVLVTECDSRVPGILAGRVQSDIHLCSGARTIDFKMYGDDLCALFLPARRRLCQHC